MGRVMDAMHRAKAMGLDETHDPPGADDGRKPIAHRARSNVRGLFCAILCAVACGCGGGGGGSSGNPPPPTSATLLAVTNATTGDRKSTRLNSSHRCISYAVFCLKKKRHNNHTSHFTLRAA